jgi:BlaI family transcriptional regulator, penicillinase repressor
MHDNPPPRPTDAELEILTVLWSRGPSTVRDVHEITAKSRPTQYTTVLKLMQIMAEKGLLRRDEERRAHVYEAACPPEWTQKQLAGDLLQRAFNGSAARLLQGALSARKASKAELAELRKLLDDYERRTR